MLAKLLKYEIKATARKFLPLYCAITIVSIFINLGINFPNLSLLSRFSIFLLTVLFISLIVITLMTIIQRFKNNLLSDEGYLMFTLPVSTEKLILSKLITAVLWGFASLIIAALSFLIIVFNRNIFSVINELLMRFSYYIGLIEARHVWLFALFILCAIFQFVYFILLVYGSLSVAQMAIFHKRRGLVSFTAFILSSFVISNIVGLIFSNLFQIQTIPPMLNVNDMTLFLGTATAVNVALSIIMFFATDYLLKKHLNIE